MTAQAALRADLDTVRQMMMRIRADNMERAAYDRIAAAAAATVNLLGRDPPVPASPEDFGMLIRGRDGAMLVFEERQEDMRDLFVGNRQYAEPYPRSHSIDKLSLEGSFTTAELRRIIRHFEGRKQQ